MNKKNINSGFAILNIIMGVILFISSITMCSSEGTGGGITFLFTAVGLILWITGWYALHYRKKSKENQELDVRGIKLVNTICFVISALLLAAVIILPILGNVNII